jgi:peptide/nickel transport system substrate-binding protein
MGARVGAVAAAVFAAVVLVLVAACSGGDDKTGSAAGGSGGGLKKIEISSLARIVTGDKCEKLDPHTVESGSDAKVLIQIYETLVAVDPADVNRLVDKLAKSHTVAADAKSVEFDIRPNVTFHDGTPLDAEACVFSLKRVMMKPYQGVTWPLVDSPYATEYEFIEDVRANGMKLTITLKEAVAPLALRNLTMFAASIASPKLLAATKTMTAQEASSHIAAHPAGTGPFKTSNPTLGGGPLRLEANESYWDGAPEVKTLIFQQVADEDARFEDLKGGKAQVVDEVPRPRWTSVGDQMDTWWALNVCYLGVNVLHEKTKETNVRRAIQLAVERDALLELYSGTARPAYSMVARPFADYDENLKPPMQNDPREKRIAEAKKLVEAAGAKGRKITLWYPKDERPYLPQPAKLADKIRQQLNETGLEVSLCAEENKKLFGGLKNDTYELVLIGWMTDNGDPDNFYSPLCGGDRATKRPSNNNAGRLYDDSLMSQIEAARAVTDASKRRDAYRAIEKRLQNEFVAHIPLLNSQQGVAFSKTITGIERDGLGFYRFHKAKRVS